MILLDKVATKVHLTYDDGGENHKERVLVYIGVNTVDSLVHYFYHYFHELHICCLKYTYRSHALKSRSGLRSALTILSLL